MGDNRPRSSDSREFCAVPVENIIGDVFYRYFPSNVIRVISIHFRNLFVKVVFLFSLQAKFSLIIGLGNLF